MTDELAIERGQNWTPIGGQDCRPFDTDAGTAAKRSFIICNTFSRSAIEPNRFRVVLLYRRPATSIDQHQAVFDAVVSRLEKQGYTKESAKLDGSGRSGIQSHFMPGTNREHELPALFEIYGTHASQISRFGIDPATYWKTTPATPTRALGVVGERTSTTAEIEDLAAKIQGMPEGRHKLFFKLATKLAFHYRERVLVEQYLARVAGADPKLQKKARDAVASLLKDGSL